MADENSKGAAGRSEKSIEDLSEQLAELQGAMKSLEERVETGEVSISQKQAALLEYNQGLLSHCKERRARVPALVGSAMLVFLAALPEAGLPNVPGVHRGLLLVPACALFYGVGVLGSTWRFYLQVMSRIEHLYKQHLPRADEPKKDPSLPEGEGLFRSIWRYCLQVVCRVKNLSTQKNHPGDAPKDDPFFPNRRRLASRAHLLWCFSVASVVVFSAVTWLFICNWPMKAANPAGQPVLTACQVEPKCVVCQPVCALAPDAVPAVSEKADPPGK